MLRLFGTMSFENTQLAIDRSLYLMALLACQNDWMTREERMLLLWDDSSDELIEHTSALRILSISRLS